MKPGHYSIQIDASHEMLRISEEITSEVLRKLRKKGAVVAVSGGVDSAVCLGLCARALGPGSVLAVFLPDRDSSQESARLASLVSSQFGVHLESQDISPILEAAGAYGSQEAAIQDIWPDFKRSWDFKIVLPALLEAELIPTPRIQLATPSGEERIERLPHRVHLKLIAATNYKQRTRKMIEYYHADRLGYAVCGTPNRLEYDLGFFVKGGDGLADFKPIAHLYKSHVYALAEVLGVPEDVVSRNPTTDTFPLEQSQEEFYYGAPLWILDLCLFGMQNDLTAEYVARVADLTQDQVERVWKSIRSKKHAAALLHRSDVTFGESRSETSRRESG